MPDSRCPTYILSVSTDRDPSPLHSTRTEDLSPPPQSGLPSSICLFSIHTRNYVIYAPGNQVGRIPRSVSKSCAFAGYLILGTANVILPNLTYFLSGALNQDVYARAPCCLVLGVLWRRTSRAVCAWHQGVLSSICYAMLIGQGPGASKGSLCIIRLSRK